MDLVSIIIPYYKKKKFISTTINSAISQSYENIEILKPLNSYGISKQLVDLYLKNNDLLKEVLSLKFFNIFGVNEFHKGHMRSIAHWGVESIINNNCIKLFKFRKSLLN